MAKKIKISRKQIRQPDEFITWFDHLMDWLQKNSLQVAAGVTGLIVALGAGQGYLTYRDRQADTKINDLSEAIRTAQAPLQGEFSDAQFIEGVRSFSNPQDRLEEASRQLTKIIAADPSGPQAMQAKLFLAGSYYEAGGFRDAIKIYNEVLNATPGLTDDLKPVAYLGLASSHFNLGNFQEALDTYNKIIAQKNALNRDEALVGAARCYENLNDAEQAVKSLEQALDEYPNTVATRGAAHRLELLKKAQVMIEKQTPAGEK